MLRPSRPPLATPAPHARGRAAWRALVLPTLATVVLLLSAIPPAAAQPPVGDADGDGDSAPAAASRAPAVVIDAGSVARRQVVAMGQDVRIAGEALSDVAALDGSVEVTGSVVGNVIVLSGDARLGPDAEVGGDVFVLGGRIETVPGATIAGRSVAHPTASAAWVTLLEGPTLGLPATDPIVLGAKLALLAAWMILALALFAIGGREMLATSATVAREPFRCFLTGLVGVLALVLTALLLSALTAPLVGVPLLVLVVLAALVLKLWGMVAVFHALGAWVAERVTSKRALVLNALTLGLVLLGVAKLLPLVGTWVWTVATLIGVGASLASKLGREEAWFRLAELDRPVTQRS